MYDFEIGKLYQLTKRGSSLLDLKFDLANNNSNKTPVTITNTSDPSNKKYLFLCLGPRHNSLHVTRFLFEDKVILVHYVDYDLLEKAQINS